MAEFSFTAVDAQGALVRGTLEGETAEAVVAALRRRGHIPMQVGAPGRWTRTVASGLGGLGGLRRRDLRRGELAALTRELAVMLGAGQDIDRALRFLVESVPGARARAVLGGVRDRVRDGQTLHAAMARYPGSFPRLYIGMVRAAEAGGDLAPTMDRLATLLERERALAATVQSAMIYPCILTLAACGSIVLLLTEVLPQFTPLFAQNGAELPASTRLMIRAGELLGRYGLLIPLVLLALAVLARAVLRYPGARLRLDTGLLALPVAGRLLREVLAARFTRILGTLLENGVPILGALSIVRDAIGNRAVARAVDAATQAAKGGRGLSAALEAASIFPRRTVHLLRLGEETARLGPMALRAADIHEEQVRIATQRLVALLVPAITIIMGLLVAGIVSSLLLAMLSLNDLAK
ncbi:type II secretion system protein [Gluconacetobacter diazotrophicus PA1 5]|uniref:LsdF n=2 Tax=Gluconacetobacter diazotrophicus TaxID=33996 RepID=Q8KIK8_GLUDI|nr:type II secretion system F family protein [Gluconacetobacter diazotrophicus]AAM92869.1 LsdF [Gluconacetobacter diazotrophicus]ACI51304.1 type II secretion system protein [Gluconacetobacter diazotrophicus PA1 5]MBB2154993.1 type II secretion system F family protein [Gluconacetobacter diazotrophicus]TWB09852.1 general secretion pathway protein F [Gluconacetobacter diazotrophicus]CAP54425.1 putative general secretion pathway protein F [Gluconacetobacter diazotrophicus PA1 5]